MIVILFPLMKWHETATLSVVHSLKRLSFSYPILYNDIILVNLS